MSTILVSVICNIIAALILLGCIFNGVYNSWKLSIIKLAIMIGCGVGCYFATPALSNIICNVAVNNTTIGSLLTGTLGVSILTLNSILFTLMFMLAYGINCIICSIIKHSIIKSYRSNAENSAKIKRAKSINPKAEKLAKKAIWRDLKTKYKSNNSIFKRIIAGFVSAISGIVLGLVILMPFGYIAEDLNKVNNGTKVFLEQGFDYTLNGLIDEKIDFKVFDWLVSVNSNANTSGNQ